MMRALAPFAVALCACVPVDVPGLAPQPAEPALTGPERIEARIPSRGAVATLGPVGRNGDTVTWTTADGVTLALAGGVLVATRGLGPDLMGAEVGPLRAALAGRGAAGLLPRRHAYLDGENRVATLELPCRLAMAAPAAADAGLRRMEETCAGAGQSFVNSYWIGAGGSVVRSVQWIGPEVGPVTISAPLL
ncbi:MAG TPA: YjbF family lipoprotein [Paracoccaceae bacterium]|nr:YjbF family lipoprotein [Paracoccaceae bacterium]